MSTTVTSTGRRSSSRSSRAVAPRAPRSADWNERTVTPADSMSLTGVPVASAATLRTASTNRCCRSDVSIRPAGMTSTRRSPEGPIQRSLKSAGRSDSVNSLALRPVRSWPSRAGSDPTRPASRVCSCPARPEGGHSSRARSQRRMSTRRSRAALAVSLPVRHWNSFVVEATRRTAARPASRSGGEAAASGGGPRAESMAANRASFSGCLPGTKSASVMAARTSSNSANRSAAWTASACPGRTTETVRSETVVSANRLRYVCSDGEDGSLRLR